MCSILFRHRKSNAKIQYIDEILDRNEKKNPTDENDGYYRIFPKNV